MVAADNMDSARLDMPDGLRGFAALLVMIHHLGPQVATLDLLPAGCLSLDFLFMLSGLVLAGTYEGRMARGLLIGGFLRLRLARLYPVMAIGIVTGTAVRLVAGADPAQIGLRFLAQMLFMPIPAGALGLYLIDGVQWSLFFELLANILHAAILCSSGEARRQG